MIIVRYVAANVLQSVPVIFTVNAADAVLTLAGLGFLGYGVPLRTAEWGFDIGNAISDVGTGAWWTSLFPGLAIVLLVTGMSLLGEGVSDILNPRLRAAGMGSEGLVPGFDAEAGAAPPPPAAPPPRRPPPTPSRRPTAPATPHRPKAPNGNFPVQSGPSGHGDRRRGRRSGRRESRPPHRRRVGHLPNAPGAGPGGGGRVAGGGRAGRERRAGGGERVREIDVGPGGARGPPGGGGADRAGRPRRCRPHRRCRGVAQGPGRPLVARVPGSRHPARSPAAGGEPLRGADPGPPAEYVEGRRRPARPGDPGRRRRAAGPGPAVPPRVLRRDAPADHDRPGGGARAPGPGGRRAHDEPRRPRRGPDPRPADRPAAPPRPGRRADHPQPRNRGRDLRPGGGDVRRPDRRRRPGDRGVHRPPPPLHAGPARRRHHAGDAGPGGRPRSHPPTSPARSPAAPSPPAAPWPWPSATRPSRSPTPVGTAHTAACHLYLGADQTHPDQAWEPAGRRLRLAEPPLAGTLR